MFRFPTKQRGAMFGLDARITMAIMAALSIVTGVSMVQIMKDNRVEEFLLFQREVATGLEMLQEDIPVFLFDIPVDNSYPGQFATLLDVSAVLPQYRSQWRGPYIREVPALFRTEYGNALGLTSHSVSSGLLGCSPTDITNGECSNFLHIGNLSYPVPSKILYSLNDQLDGSGEAIPNTMGSLRWNQGNVIMKLGASQRRR